MNLLFLEALHNRNFKRPPVWLMRQAGRHLKSYREMRDRYSFLEMCHHPHLIAEVTLLPFPTYNPDAAILFSDILVIPEAMGLGLRFEEKIGPILENPLSPSSDLSRLPPASASEALQYVAEGIRLVRPSLSVPLIGFCGAPFTLASYMIEGQSNRHFTKTKLWMYEHPASFHQLLDLLAQWAISYLLQQIEAGVDAIQIFDSWAHVLPEKQFLEFSLAYTEKILKGIAHTTVPSIVFCRGSSLFAPLIAQISPHAISVDWSASLPKVRSLLPRSIAIQGNFDPDLLLASPDIIRKEALPLLQQMKNDPGYIVNLGHGLLPNTPETSIRAFIDLVKEFSP